MITNLIFKNLFILLLLLGGSKLLLSQSHVYKNLVFEGAGIRGIAYAGVLEEFERKHILKNINRVGGTSAGAIIALAVSLGYNAKEVKEIIYHTNFNHFKDGRFLFLGGLHRLNKFYGWYRTKKIDQWLGKIIAAKTQNANCTFQELHDKGYKDLYVTATCLNKQKVIIFSYETYPNMQVSDAVKISMSIPLFFQAVCINSVGHIIDKPHSKEMKNHFNYFDIVLDGGIMANFPITIFDSMYIDSFNKKIRIPNQQTIGIRIDTEQQIQHDKTDQVLDSYEIHSFSDYLGATYVYILENLNRQTLTSDDWNRTISISSADISPVIKKMSKEQKDLLIENGRKGTKEFLSTHKLNR